MYLGVWHRFKLTHTCMVQTNRHTHTRLQTLCKHETSTDFSQVDNVDSHILTCQLSQWNFNTLFSNHTRQMKSNLNIHQYFCWEMHLQSSQSTLCTFSDLTCKTSQKGWRCLPRGECVCRLFQDTQGHCHGGRGSVLPPHSEPPGAAHWGPLMWAGAEWGESPFVRKR